MPLLIVPEIVWLTEARYGDPPPLWCPQPDGPDIFVHDLLQPSAIAQASVTTVQTEVIEFARAMPTLEPRALRPYQQDAVDAVFRAWANRKKAPIVVMGTGAGKGVLAAEIVRRHEEEHDPVRKSRVWFIAHREELLEQAYKKIKLMAPRVTCGIVQGSRRDVGKYVTVASIDTLYHDGRFTETIAGTNRDSPNLIGAPPGIVILDEAHHCVSPRYKKVMGKIREANPACLFLGLTATPGRTDGTALDTVFDCVAYERNTFQLIEDGYLVPPVGHRVKLNVNLDVVPTENGEFKKAPLSKVMNQPHLREAVIDGYVEYGQSRKFLGYCVDVQHAHDLAEAFRARGIPARAIDGKMTKTDRKATLQAFTEGKTRVLLSCDVLTEGYDDPSAQGVLFARPTQSQLVYQQILGRGLRLYPAKNECLVIDCVGNSDKFAIVQLATLAGLGDIERGEGRPRPTDDDDVPVPLGEADVNGIEGREIDFRFLRRREAKWAWRETRFGWTVQVPRVGYFLLSWASADRRLVTIRFHDMRDGKRDTPPIVLGSEMEFDLGYGLVEQELERLFTARTARARFDKGSDAGTAATREILDSGTAGELFSPEELMRNDANWRDRATSERQRQALIDLGVKSESVPGTAGEASDLFTVMTVEHNAKMREPATKKQIGFIRAQRLATDAELETMTKKQAEKLIIRRLKELEAAKKAAARFDDDDGPLGENDREDDN